LKVAWSMNQILSPILVEGRMDKLGLKLHRLPYGTTAIQNIFNIPQWTKYKFKFRWDIIMESCGSIEGNNIITINYIIPNILEKIT
jgi:hypothetical protein